MHNTNEGVTKSIARFVLLAGITLTAPAFASNASPEDGVQHPLHDLSSSSALIEKVRQATEQFRDISEADGYVPFRGCVSGPEEGAMGMHFVNFGLVDGEVDVNQPEALIYESRNGRFDLVGVEYIVPAEAWDGNHADPPTLEGHLFHFTEKPNRFRLDPFYELHVWAWRENPRGAFADWNPNVSCERQ